MGHLVARATRSCTPRVGNIWTHRSLVHHQVGKRAKQAPSWKPRATWHMERTYPWTLWIQITSKSKSLGGSLFLWDYVSLGVVWTRHVCVPQVTLLPNQSLFSLGYLTGLFSQYLPLFHFDLVWCMCLLSLGPTPNMVLEVGGGFSYPVILLAFHILRPYPLIFLAFHNQSKEAPPTTLLVSGRVLGLQTYCLPVTLWLLKNSTPVQTWTFCWLFFLKILFSFFCPLK